MTDHFGIALSIFVGLTIFLSVTLNLLVLYVFIKYYKKLEFVHIVLISIAISDILMSTVGFVPELISTINNQVMDERNIVCVTAGFFIFGFAISIIAHISVFNFFRTFAIIYPISYRWIFRSIPLRYLILFLCHVYGLSWAIFPFANWSAYKLDLDERRCSLDWNLTHPKSFSYVVCVLIFCYVIPGFVILFSICWGKRGLEKNRNSDVRKNSSFRKSQKKTLLEDNLLRLFIIMASMFFIAWTPYALTGLLALVNKAPPKFFVTLSAIFAKLASISNPIINCFINKHFRNKLLKAPWVGWILRKTICFRKRSDSNYNKDSGNSVVSRQTSEFLKLSMNSSTSKLRASLVNNEEENNELEKEFESFEANKNKADMKL